MLYSQVFSQIEVLKAESEEGNVHGCHFMKNLVLCVKKGGLHLFGKKKLLNDVESFGKQKPNL